MIAKLLHIANTSPPGPRCQKERFYRMKSQILHWFGTKDGEDIQELEGKICYGCDGGGIYYHWSGDEDVCDRCGGSGWYQRPRYITLQRWRFGSYVFHEPIGTSHKKPNIDPQIKGFVQHKILSAKSVDRSQLILALIFDWKLAAWLLLDEWRYSRVYSLFSDRCAGCHRRLWFTKRWTCKKCQAEVKTDPNTPF